MRSTGACSERGERSENGRRNGVREAVHGRGDVGRTAFGPIVPQWDQVQRILDHVGVIPVSVAVRHVVVDSPRRAASRLSRVHWNYADAPSRDMPPPGGYESLKYKRNLPTRGPGGAVVFGAVAIICALGFWRLGEGNLERR